MASHMGVGPSLLEALRGENRCQVPATGPAVVPGSPSQCWRYWRLTGEESNSLGRRLTVIKHEFSTSMFPLQTLFIILQFSSHHRPCLRFTTGWHRHPVFLTGLQFMTPIECCLRVPRVVRRRVPAQCPSSAPILIRP